MSLTVLANAFLMTPKRPQDSGILQVWHACAQHALHAMVARGGSLALLPQQQEEAPCLASCHAYLPSNTLLPPSPLPSLPLQVWLQEFAWTEADLPRKRAERASSLPPGAASSAAQLSREPMFCIEVRFTRRCCCTMGPVCLPAVPCLLLTPCLSAKL